MRQQIWLPEGFQKSISERSRINAAVSNLKTATSYLKKWIKYYKEDPSDRLLAGLQYALNWGQKYKDEFLSVQHLADLYDQLWKEKYYKAKHFYEKAEDQADLLIKNHVQDETAN